MTYLRRSGLSSRPLSRASRTPHLSRSPRSPRSPRIPRVSLLAAAAALLAAGCGSSAAVATTSGPASHKVSVLAKAVPGAGAVLVDSKGRVLYVFVPDHQKKVTCGGLCAATWPPLRQAGGKVTAGPGVKPAMLGADVDSHGGGKVVTYDGWPLYLYAGDVKPGQDNGQAINLNGGLWYVISPSGKIVTAKQ
jgi:predicted lipoprotein with Yx(FWY)xxD motif